MNEALMDLMQVILGILVFVIGITGHSYLGGGLFWKIVIGAGLILWVGGIY